MQRLNLAAHPKDVTKKILKTLSNKRAEDIIGRRFGIKDGKRHTLESIGKSYGITRERVRQLEDAAFRALSANNDVKAELASASQSLKDHLAVHGGVSEEKRYFNSVTDHRFHNNINFILLLARPVSRREEDETHHDRWYVDGETLGKAEKAVAAAVSDLETMKRPLSENELAALFKNHASDAFGEARDDKSVRSYLSIAKAIAKNPYNEYGLVSWPNIHPRGVRDKAYAALLKFGKPLHFAEVASHINKAGWSKRTAHPQTVHNELIKDNRFVLVGRGLYALAEWGYQPGTVKDVLHAVLAESSGPLSKEEITKRVLAKRMVKENTIMLNLQDKKKFKKVEAGYTLV